MEVEKPHPDPLHPPPTLAQLWGFRLPLGIYGVRCWGLVHPPPLFQGPGSAWTGHRSARADSCPGTRKRGGVGRRPPPLPGRPPGIQAGTWPAGAWGWGKLVISAPASSFHTPSLSLAPPPLSLPPAATRCQHYFPFSSFSSLPTPYPPIHPSPRPRQISAREKLSSQSFTPCSKC